MRLIKVKANNSTQILEKRMNAKTLKDVADEFMEINFEGARVVVREPRTTLESPTERLPDGDLFLFVYPQKVNSGV